MSKFLIIWNAVISIASFITKFTKTKKDEKNVEKLDNIVTNCTTISEQDVAKVKEVTKKNLNTAKEIKEILKK